MDANYDIFIAYHGDNITGTEKEAIKLYEILTSYGIKVYCHPVSNSNGSYVDIITNIIPYCSHFILLAKPSIPTDLNGKLLRNKINGAISDLFLEVDAFYKDIWRTQMNNDALAKVILVKENNKYLDYLNAQRLNIVFASECYKYDEIINDINNSLFYKNWLSKEFIVESNINANIINTYKREGNKIYFGSYYRDNKKDMVPIEWDIIDEKDGKALIITHNIIDSMPFLYFDNMIEKEDGYYNGMSTVLSTAPEGTSINNYEHSNIRYWLNEDFYYTAFSDEEKSIIEVTLVDNSAESTEQKYNYYSCNDTFDKIFALSVKEAKYFSSYDKIQARGSDYALGNGLLDSHWWLRSPVANDASKAYYVFRGLILYDVVASTDGGIRPACWIKL